MTWSIIARDELTGKFGIAVATRFFAVGALVPYTRAKVGAVATQALINPFFGLNGLRLLQNHRAVADVLSTLVASDHGRDHRQVHIMDANGCTAAHTGSLCVGWCGAISQDNLSVAGNMLANAEVIAATAAVYRAQSALPLAARLIASMKAGEAAGGDKRGRQSAALVIQGDEDWPDLSLRVDDHTDPLAELDRLERVSRERFVHFAPFLPCRDNPVGTTDRAVIEAGIEKALAAQAR
ncbi:MAG: DUF1028 domain-containing protein [Pseudolabrys sp.]|nr:DUF1028 domain-containing protein [Pseudolabrys sp.]MBV9260584.1 DUF1028 domain-containing protein [Pseudolabrys sp.]